MFSSSVTRRGTSGEQIKASLAEHRARKQALQVAFTIQPCHFCVLKIIFFFSLSAQKNLRVKSQFIRIKICLPRQLVASTSVMMMWWGQTWLPEGLKFLFSRPCRVDNLRHPFQGCSLETINWELLEMKWCVPQPAFLFPSLRLAGKYAHVSSSCLP